MNEEKHTLEDELHALLACYTHEEIEQYQKIISISESYEVKNPFTYSIIELTREEN